MKRYCRAAAQTRTPALKCPQCSRIFLIGPDSVTGVVATGRRWASGRAELRCGICGAHLVVERQGGVLEGSDYCELCSRRAITSVPSKSYLEVGFVPIEE